MSELEVALKMLKRALEKLKKNPPNTNQRLWASYVRVVSSLAQILSTVEWLNTLTEKVYEHKESA